MFAAITGPAPTIRRISSTPASFTSAMWRGSGLSAHLLNHWNIAPLIRYQSGLPVNPASGKDNSLTGVGNDRPDVVSTHDLHRRAARVVLPVHQSRTST